MSERVKVSLVCTVCQSRNYKTTRRVDHQGAVRLKKHCPTCNKHTEHVETK